MSQENMYEAERAARIAANKARMAELGVLNASQKIAATAAAHAASEHKRRRVMSPPKARKPTIDAPRRVSRRARGEAPPELTDAELARELYEPTYNEETYSSAQVAALGTCETPWTLFVDGCDEHGRRVYDQVNAQCCHQCRQKTKGMRTKCETCGMMRGVYCGDCLMMRQGENILEVNARGADWKCPSCRDICNCSFCRTRRGWPPTGAMYREALAAGFESVAHYLILSNQEDKEAREVALKVAEVKAKEYAIKQEAEAASRPPESPRDKRPHWLKEKVYAE
jgi:cell division cycle-associated protein 7